MGGENKPLIFSSQKQLLKKFFKLSVDVSSTIRTGFGVLLQPPNDLEVTYIVFKKYRFFDEKTKGAFFDLHTPFLYKTSFFHQKIDFFQRQ